MTEYTRKSESGAVDGWMIATIGLGVLALAAGSLAIWGLLQYQEQKTNVDAKTDVAVAEAKKQQADEDEVKFAEREKNPKSTFVGPDDYGRLTFDYPKTWSSYVNKDVSKGGTYEAYLNPTSVPPVTTAGQQFAIRVTIEEKAYEKAIAEYESLVKKGDLRTTSVAANGVNGTRFDGNFTKDIRGAAVVFKVRDKTVTIRTDADTFKPDFDTLVATIKFNE